MHTRYDLNEVIKIGDIDEWTILGGIKVRDYIVYKVQSKNFRNEHDFNENGIKMMIEQDIDDIEFMNRKK
jgi:hypothetical protein